MIPALIVLVLAPRAALAIPCDSADEGVVTVDGLLGDWADVAPTRLATSGELAGPSDLAATLRCNHDGRALYLALDVQDDYLVRTPRALAGEDQVVVALPGLRLEIFPADFRGAERVVRAGPPARRPRPRGRRPPAPEVAESLQPRGWSLELAVPLALLPPAHRDGAAVPIELEVRDCDSKARLATEARASTGPGRLAFSEPAALLDGLLAELRLSVSDVWFDQLGDVGGERGAERVIVAGTTLAAVGREYAYVALPAASRKDVLEARLVDLGGQGRKDVVVRYRERGGGGEREVVAAYHVGSTGFVRSFGVEVAKRQGGRRLLNRLAFAPRGRATDLEVEVAEAAGWDAATYREAPASDVAPILLPWSGPRRVRYRFTGDEYVREER